MYTYLFTTKWEDFNTIILTMRSAEWVTKQAAENSLPIVLLNVNTMSLNLITVHKSNVLRDGWYLSSYAHKTGFFFFFYAHKTGSFSCRVFVNRPVFFTAFVPDCVSSVSA